MSWGPGKERRGLKIAVFFCLVLRMLYERETDFEVRILGIWCRESLKPGHVFGECVQRQNVSDKGVLMQEQ